MNLEKIKKRISRRGFALLMVIVSLVTLMLMAIPFIASMQMERKITENVLSKARARIAATGAYHYAVSRLKQSCEMQEKSAKQSSVYKTPYYDTPQEYKVDIKLPELDVKNPRGQIWSALVSDEQGKINVNSATPWLLGNLMGSALAKETASSSDTTIIVDSTAHFPKYGGWLWVNGELIQYKEALKDRFIGCGRGKFSNLPKFKKAREIDAGTIICDVGAYLICQHRLIVRKGQFTPYRTIEEIRQVADLKNYSLDIDKFDRIEQMLTVHSGRDSNWIYPQKILKDIPSSGNQDPSDGSFVYLDDLSFYAKGMTIKISQGRQIAYAMILDIQPNQKKLILDRRLKRSFRKEEAIICVQQPHPIQINSAPPAVLFSILKGLRTTTNWIDRKEAWEITKKILEWRQKTGIQSYKHLKDLLLGLRKELHSRRVLDEKRRPALSTQEIEVILESFVNIARFRKRYDWPLPEKTSQKIPSSPPLAPVVFRNHDTYTIEASAIINNRSGLPLAQHSTRRIVSIAPLPFGEKNAFLKWKLENQYDFQYYLNRLPSLRVITWGNLEPVVYFSNFPSFDPQIKKTGISLDTVPLNPKSPQLGSLTKYESWSSTYHGNSYNGESYPAQITSSPCCLSFWFRPESVGKIPYYIFDLGEKKFENRIFLVYDRRDNKNKLCLQIADATLDEKFAELSYAMTMNQEWYHVMVGWHNTAPGGLFLWVDGEPQGQFLYREGRYSQRAVLRGKLDVDSTVVRVDNTHGFDARGAILIGGEAIEYEKLTGSTFVIREKYPLFNGKIAGRGARGTTASKHPSGALVFPFGYSTTSTEKIFPATELAGTVPGETLYTKLNFRLESTANSIRVKSAANFQASGYIMIVDQENISKTEKVWYSSVKSGEFRGCKRGQLNTSASSFEEAWVFPISIRVNDHSNYPDSGMIQLDNEWIAYERKTGGEDSSKLVEYLVCNISSSALSDFKSTGNLRPDYRGICNTQSTTHEEKKLVVPVFKTNAPVCGRFDKVTLIYGENPKLHLDVNWAYQNYVAFTEISANKIKENL